VISNLSEKQINFINKIAYSETGLSVFETTDKTYTIIPPFPILNSSFNNHDKFKILKDTLNQKYIIGVILLRLGRYAICILKGEELLHTKTKDRYVKNRHKAGGSSQRRFERSRERLIRELYDKTCEITKDIFEPYENKIDYLLFGGEKHTINGLHKRCTYIEKFKKQTLKRLLTIQHEPNQKTLENIHKEVWKSKLYEISNI